MPSPKPLRSVVSVKSGNPTVFFYHWNAASSMNVQASKDSGPPFTALPLPRRPSTRARVWWLGSWTIATPSASSSVVLAPLPRRHPRSPHHPSLHHCRSRCSDGLSQTPRQPLIPSLLGNPHQHFRHPHRHYRGLLVLHRHSMQDLRLEVLLQE